MIATIALVALVQDTSRHVTWSAYVDSYYAWDGGRPANFDRGYTTQAARHNEFNINLAHVAASLTSSRVRGRVALQAGTSVQSNYAGEPVVGNLSGGTLSRHIQEATVGARLAPSLWVDGGVYFSYIGLEGWISRDNPTYTRSLVAEFTPYYLSGVHLTWQPSAKLTAQVHVMNGWQNMSENNSSKAVGARLDWQALPSLTLTYGNFTGNEQPQGSPARTRLLNQLMAKATLGVGLLIQGQVDVGHEGTGRDWYGFTLIGRKELGPAVAVAGRIERYSDPDQVIVVTGTPSGLVTNGASLGLDVGAPGGVLWRTEVRGLRATAELFPSAAAPNASRTNIVLVTSLALSLSGDDR